MRSVVLTGGDHAGKTTLVEAFRSEGHAVVGEAALQVIEELNAELGVDAQRRWREANWTEFQARVAALQGALEEQARASGAEVLVLDRGLPDGIAFCQLARVELPAALRTDLRGRYDRVLLLDTVTPFAARSETGRLGGLERSRALRDRLAMVYGELGYEPEPLPLLPLAERMERVRALLR